MSVLLQRPRIVIALGGALVAIVVAAMLAGGALAGDVDCPAPRDAGDQPRTQR